MPPRYQAPQSFGDIARSATFFVQASAAMAVGAAGSLLRSAIPVPVARTAEWLGVELETAVFGEVATAPQAIAPKHAAVALLAGVAGVPFFLSVAGVEAGMLLTRRAFGRAP
jgi:hypothetical protein